MSLLHLYITILIATRPTPLAAQSKAWVYGRSLAGIAGSNPAGGYKCLSVVSIVCYRVEISASGWSLVQRSPTDCDFCLKRKAGICTWLLKWLAGIWKLKFFCPCTRGAFKVRVKNVLYYYSQRIFGEFQDYNEGLINPLNPELNPICYLLALLGAHHFLHVSRIRVKLLTFRLLMSYIYGAPILDVSRSHTTTQHSR